MGATIGVLLTFSRSPDPGWAYTLLKMHRASLTFLGTHQHPASTGEQAARETLSVQAGLEIKSVSLMTKNVSIGVRKTPSSSNTEAGFSHLQR